MDCPIFLRQTFVEWANQSRHHYCAWAQAYYRMQRAKGNSHPAAMRSLAFKWIRILFRCWKNREAYPSLITLGGRNLNKTSETYVGLANSQLRLIPNCLVQLGCRVTANLLTEQAFQCLDTNFIFRE